MKKRNVYHRLFDIYRRHIKHSLLNQTQKRLFGSFGTGSEIELPWIHGQYVSNIFIGNHTTVLKHSRMQIYPDKNGRIPSIKIGNHCYLGYYLSILAAQDVVIGSHVLFASNITITSENHGMNPESAVSYMNQELIGKPVSIGDGCWIGEKVIILPGVHIGRKSIIGGGSVVTKDVEDYCIAAGNPARVIKRYDFLEHKWKKSEE